MLSFDPLRSRRERDKNLYLNIGTRRQIIVWSAGKDVTIVNPKQKRLHYHHEGASLPEKMREEGVMILFGGRKWQSDCKAILVVVGPSIVFREKKMKT